MCASVIEWCRCAQGIPCSFGDAGDLLGVALAERGEQDAGLDWVEQVGLKVERLLHCTHHLADGLVGLGRDAGQLALVVDDLEQASRPTISSRRPSGQTIS